MCPLSCLRYVASRAGLRAVGAELCYSQDGGTLETALDPPVTQQLGVRTDEARDRPLKGCALMKF